MAEQYVVVLLVKLAVSASLASILVRVGHFKRLLLKEERSITERLFIAGSISVTFGGAAAVRVITGTYTAADVGLEGCFIAGLVGGYVPGLLAGVLVSIPGMSQLELLTMPLFAAVGVLGGLLRDAAPDPEEVYVISPFLDRTVYRLIRSWPDTRRAVFHLFYVLSVGFIEFLRLAGFAVFGPGAIFTLYPTGPGAHWSQYALHLVSTAFCVLVPIKIWGSARTELKFLAQQRLLQEAQLRALTSQINPHFLFNTLNSIASLVRTRPDTARQVIHKLSNILRRLLRRHDSFSSLRDELAFIEDYLSIEIVRFGDKLKFVKEVDANALDASVPSMLLQPLVENSIKHGLAGKGNGGTIRIRAWRTPDRVHLQVEDDGVGIPEANLAKLFERGIGVSNVNERLKVLFGSDYKMWIDSKPGEGTRTGIDFPIHTPSLQGGASHAAKSVA